MVLTFPTPPSKLYWWRSGEIEVEKVCVREERDRCEESVYERWWDGVREGTRDRNGEQKRLPDRENRGWQLKGLWCFVVFNLVCVRVNILPILPLRQVHRSHSVTCAEYCEMLPLQALNQQCSFKKIRVKKIFTKKFLKSNTIKSQEQVYIHVRGGTGTGYQYGTWNECFNSIPNLNPYLNQ